MQRANHSKNKADVQEVVSLGAGSPCHPDELPERTGIHLQPEEWHEAMLQPAPGPTPILLDTRNIYETSVGHFKAVSPSMTSVRPLGNVGYLLLQPILTNLQPKACWMFCSGKRRSLQFALQPHAGMLGP